MLNREYKFLKLWEHPQNYAGQIWPAYYVGLSRNQYSKVLDESNFYVFIENLGGESETVQIVREKHSHFGWIEWIAIHQDDEKACRKADAMLQEIEEYPILDEADYYNRQLDAVEALLVHYTDDEILKEFGGVDEFYDVMMSEV